ncbi:MAG: T9SS type A sorting domain-containing protein [Ignavibacteriales bacterium]|nr:T9SS type A sorting domain-containing protein [Ignavibacteriales bacterium]
MKILQIFNCINFYINFLFAQNTATIDLENGRVDGGNYKFDVSITRTSDWGANFLSSYLNSSSSRFDYNSTALGAPSVSAGPHFSNGDHSVTVSIITDQINVETNFTFNGNNSALVLGTKYLLFTVTLPILNASESAGITWVAASTAFFQGDDENITSTLNGDLNTSPLPVELSTFNVNSVEGTKAQLEWETATEVNNYGFEIERSVVTESAEATWEKVAFVEGHGNSNSPKLYSFTDKNLVGGSKFAYRLKQIDIDGTFEYSDVIEVEVLPTKYELFQNYPNPFNPSTNIKFSLPEDAKVNINIYNVLGERVASVLSEELKAGFHQIDFNSNSAGYQLSSGVYLYTIESKNFSQVKKMILMK